MKHTYTMSINDPWNMGETEDFESDTPFHVPHVGDELITKEFSTKSTAKHRKPCRVTKVSHCPMKHKDWIQSHIQITIEPIE